MQLLFFCLPNEMNYKDLHLQHPNVCILLLFAATVESFKNKIVDHTSPDQGKSFCEFLLLGSCSCEFPSLYTYLQ